MHPGWRKEVEIVRQKALDFAQVTGKNSGPSPGSSGEFG